MLDEAIELITNTVPEWQITESLRRLAEMKSNPSSTIDGKDFFESIDDEA
jgi:Putative addiction module component